MLEIFKYSIQISKVKSCVPNLQFLKIQLILVSTIRQLWWNLENYTISMFLANIYKNYITWLKIAYIQCLRNVIANLNVTQQNENRNEMDELNEKRLTRCVARVDMGIQLFTGNKTVKREKSKSN